MNLRIRAAKKINCFGRFVQNLALFVMRPEDLIRFSRLTYSKAANVESWSRSDLVGEGLYPNEAVLLQNLPVKNGRLLLLGLGGGREAIPFAAQGFLVTGVDFVPEMVLRAEENVRRHGLVIQGLVQEISQLDVHDAAYDVVWFSLPMYSAIPTRKRRIAMLKKIHRALRPGGYLVCQFHWQEKKRESLPAWMIKKTFAWLTLGHVFAEKGDQLWQNVEFIHVFSSENDLRFEFTQGGFEVLKFFFSKTIYTAGALLRKSDLVP